ncbi:MAG: transglutaminaseTgpA domain-containing protein [Acidimicrobiales bacterium]
MSARRALTARPTAGEVALGVVTATAVVGMARLFSDTSFLAPLLVVVVAGHGLAVVLRRFGVSLALAAVASGLGLLVVIGWVVEPRTLTFGLPLAGTWHAIRVDLTSASDLFARVRAPTPTTRGFVVACAAAVWTAAFAADTFAFRARARFEALVPSFVLFLFGAILGASRFRLAAAGLYLGGVLAFVVLADPSRRTGQAWFGGRSVVGSRALARSGLVTSLIVVALALVLAPRLPGARAAGVVNLNKGSDGSGSRVTVSPLVDIRSRLVDQSGTELFSVSSDVGTYWRLTSLERFDGTIWSSVGSYEPARGRLPSGVASRSDTQTVVQQFDIGALSAIWLPAAYRAQRLDGISGVRFDADSASLLTEAPSADGLRYSVESSLPRLTVDDLATASPTLAGDQSRRYLDLPPGFPTSVRDLARRVTDPAGCRVLGCSADESTSGRLTAFHQARALQDWFRTNFTYDLNVPPGHDDSAIQRFLAIRRGYCEQFAGTFAAMARSLGLPSRVAVGFTTGTLGDDHRYHVTGREAHAWPEVYLDPYGWVAFEPTPGRAHPGTEAYTGVGATAPVPGGGQAAAATTAPPVTTAPAAGRQAPTTGAPVPARAAAGAGGTGSGWPLPASVALGLAVAAIYLGGVPLAYRIRQSRRRGRAATPTDRVMLAWSEAEEDLARAGLGQRPAETPTEYATRARTGLATTPVGLAMVDLAGQLTSAAYSPAGADDAAAGRAESAAATVRTAVRAQAGPVARTLWSLDPRPLVRAADQAWPGRIRPGQRSSTADRR